MPVQPLLVGDPAEVAGYRVRGRLGSGGMGVVYLAFTPGGRPVALKVIRPELSDDPGFRARFGQEIAAARRVHGLYTAQLLDADPGGSRPWLATAYVAGPSLEQAVAVHGPMPPPSVFLLLAGVAEALGVIQAVGLVHRDLKPSNVLLAADGPRVIDFGIARAIEATTLTRTGTLVGSPQYMAPEQVQGAEVGPAADVFALGALGGYAATGRPPFGADSEAAVLYRVLHEVPDLKGCPGPLRAVLEGCLVKDPAARPTPGQVIQSCRERAAARTVELAESWLPPAMAADLALHAPPAPVLAEPAVVADAVTLAPAAAGQQALPAAGTGPTAAVTVGSGRSRRYRWRLSRPAVIAGTAVAVLVAAVVSYAELASTRPGSHAQRHPGAAPFRPPDARTRPNATASASPSPASTLDPCLFGTWIGISDDSPGTINGQPVMYTGSGVTQIFRPDGINVLEFGPSATETVRFQGNTWTSVISGRATVRYETVHGEIVSYGTISVHGTKTILENGSVNSTVPLTLNTQPDLYTCSGNTLKLFIPDGESEVLRRSTQPATPARLGS